MKYLTGTSLATVVALAISGCGGSGGGESVETATPEMTPVIEPPTPDTYPAVPDPGTHQAGSAAILALGNKLQIGPIIAPKPSALAQGPTHDDIQIRQGTVQDGVGKEYLIAYIEDDASRPNVRLSFPPYQDGFVERFGEVPPEVVVANGTSEEHLSDVVRAVQLINAWLPPDWQLTVASEPSEDTRPYPQNGQIVTMFAPWTEFAPVAVAGRYGAASEGVPATDGRTRFSYRNVHGTVWVDPETSGPGANGMRGTVSSLVHEIIHTLGRTHVDAEKFPETTMATNRNRANDSPDILGALDKEGLQAVYQVFSPGTVHQYIAEDLGHWEDESNHLVGEFNTANDGPVTFGASERNGFVQAWANGPTPWSNLADNTTVTGSATWDGRLIGLTPRSEAVAGDASLTVYLTDMTGQAGFTSLEQWGANIPMGELGTGTVWGDGDLGYDIAVRGNTFVRTGGDEGSLAGAFLGRDHEAMAGTVKREDLVAAFAGKR